MVKADPKQDYYADLEVASTADTETIKKKFRELAKQYHPDRNPGKEAEVVPKFQAIQAAHEILGDPVQKAKYDAERARLNKPARDADSPGPPFKKPQPPRRTDSGYPNGNFAQPASQPPPRRDPSATRYAAQTGPRRPNSATAPPNDKFAQYARGAPPQQQRWDQAKFEEAARADAYRGMNAMKGGGMPQTSPLRARAHPTAPRPGGAGNDPYLSGSEPPSGYSGLGRSASGRRFNGHGPPGDDPPPTRSAYAQYHRTERDRPPSAGPYSNPEPSPHYRPRETVSPSRSSRPYPPDDFQNARPELGSRTSSRYARTGGERTNLAPGNIGRSASVRTSPVDKRWDEESGPFGVQSQPDDHHTRPRHRSHSPPRPGASKLQSASETSSDEDEPPRPGERPRANLRRPYTHAPGSEPVRPTDDGMSGYFPKTNYNSRVVDDHTYAFPAPEMKGTPLRQAASHNDAPDEFHDGHNRRTSQEDVSGLDNPQVHDSSNGGNGGNGDGQFSAEQWHDTLGSKTDMFSPPDSMNKDRKSPNKTSRTSRPTPRSYANTKDVRREAGNNDLDASIMAGVKHISPSEAREKAAAFQSGRLPNDFAEKVNGQRHGSKSMASEPRAEELRPDSGYTNILDRPTSDAMDLDSPPQDGTSPSPSDGRYNVTVEEEHSPMPPIPPRQHHHRHESQSSGLDLNGLGRTAPFAPSESGLRDLNDLGDQLPWASRPSDTLEALHRTNSSALRELNLPRPPKAPHALTEGELDQHSWKIYGDSMTNYMHDWNKFSNAMIEHFRARQEAVTHGMYRNWVCAQGDGATADDFLASGGSDRAGYATYMTWLDDDRKCRVWWDVASEEHRMCMEGLGKVRKRVKELNGGPRGA